MKSALRLATSTVIIVIQRSKHCYSHLLQLWPSPSLVIVRIGLSVYSDNNWILLNAHPYASRLGLWMKLFLYDISAAAGHWRTQDLVLVYYRGPLFGDVAKPHYTKKIYHYSCGARNCSPISALQRLALPSAHTDQLGSVCKVSKERISQYR